LWTTRVTLTISKQRCAEPYEVSDYVEVGGTDDRREIVCA
jgi:hypothetical protein